MAHTETRKILKNLRKPAENCVIMLAVANIYRKKTPEEKTGRKVLKKSQTGKSEKKTRKESPPVLWHIGGPGKNYE